MTKRIVIADATGKLGVVICKRLLARGDSVIVVSRNPKAMRKTLRGAHGYAQWQLDDLTSWQTILQDADVVLNFAGDPIFDARRSSEHKNQAREMRIQGAQIIVKALKSLTNPPKVFISSSSVGIYGYSDDSDRDFPEQAVPDDDAYTEGGFQWEKAAFEAEGFGIRVVLLRTGFLLDNQSGRLPGIAKARQSMREDASNKTSWIPWLHIKDYLGLIEFAIDDDRTRGGLNLTAPGIVRSDEFQETLAQLLQYPNWLALFEKHMKTSRAEASPMLTNGKRIIPQKALDLGYEFQFPILEPALSDLLTPCTKQKM